jgi:cobalt-zinc-cadmium efflux system membrane fusion protein
MKSNCKFLSRAGALFAASLGMGMAACHQQPAAPASASNSQATEDPIRYVAASEQPVQDQLDLSAKVQADPAKSYRVFAPASGRVLSIQVKPGDMVKRGETLATIDSADAAAAESDLVKAEIEAERAQRAADRQKILFDHGAIAEKDYIDTKAAADSAEAELARSRRHLEVLGMTPGAKTDRIPLLSPSPGIVLTVSAAAGEFSKSLDNSDPLLTIADLSTVWIMGDVFEKDIAKVQPGTKVSVTVDAFPGQQLAGHIDSVSGALDPTTRTLKVRVALANPGQKMKPEMFAAIHVDLGNHKAVVVPSTAVIHEGLATVVYVEINGKPEQRNVTTGRAVDGKVEITSGLEAGQQIAVNGAELLTGGASQP